MKKNFRAVITALVLSAALGITGCGSEKESKEFSPRLDTEAEVVISTAGFFGNFEALDQVTNDFNKYYPNVEFNYEQISSEGFEDYLNANQKIDIVMTSEELFAKGGKEFEDRFADLSKEDIDLSALDEKMLSRGYHDGKLSVIPMGQNIYGLVVNVSLLEKEGLSVPTNYDEFVNALKTLKEKGYTPIQGPESKVYAELTQSMAFDIILDDKTLCKDLLDGKESAADKLLPVFDRLSYIIDNGFTDAEINQTYPADNYDQAILKFFEGDVPFWVCNTEKVSGMKKRESKSEAFQANSFEYTYINVPLGDKGVYLYSEPWFGFAVNKNAANYKYAVEFVRFLAAKDEINTMADVKGVPSVAVEKSDVEIYKNILNPAKVEMECVNEGNITPEIISDWYTCVNKYAAGDFSTEKEALEYFVELCSK